MKIEITKEKLTIEGTHQQLDMAALMILSMSVNRHAERLSSFQNYVNEILPTIAGGAVDDEIVAFSFLNFIKEKEVSE